MKRSFTAAFRGYGCSGIALAGLMLAACSDDPLIMQPMVTAGMGVAGVPAAGTSGAAGATGAAGSTAVGTAGAGAAGRAGAAAAGSGGTGSGAAGASAGAPAAGSGGAAGAAGSEAGSGGAAGAAGAAGATAGAGGSAGAAGAPAMHEDLGKGDGADVVTIGDSWMSNTLGTGNAIEGALSRLTRQPYRNYGVQGVLLTQDGLFGAAVPSQYASAKRRDPDIKTVIMTGGGNDIIQDASVQASCETGGDACLQTLMKISMTLNTLWSEMATDGVEDVIYVRYADSAGSTAPSVREMGRVPPLICTMGKIRCHSIETTDAVMGALLADGIHPTQAANDRMAKVIVDYMEKNGIRR